MAVEREQKRECHHDAEDPDRPRHSDKRDLQNEHDEENPDEQLELREPDVDGEHEAGDEAEVVEPTLVAHVVDTHVPEDGERERDDGGEAVPQA